MEAEANGNAFENVKDQIGPCGIWCGSCVAGNGTLRELTRKYEEVIKAYDVEQWGPKDFDFKEFLKGLASLQNIPLCPGCLKGGGREDCEMRACTAGKGIEECCQCDDQAACAHSELLEKMRTGARDAGLAVKTTDGNKQPFIEQETAKLKDKWPSCVLFMNGQ